MIAQTYNGIIAESKKIKNTFTFWFTIASAMFIPFLVLLIQMIQPEKYVPVGDANPWDTIFSTNLSLVSNFLFPFYIILTIALNLSIEHKEDSWKKILLLPISRTNIYFNKVIFLIIQVISALILFFVTILLSGVILGFAHSEIKYLEYIPNFTKYLLLLFHLFVAILGIFSIQYLLSLFFKNMIIPIATGVFGVIATFIVSGWKYAIYFPYAFCSLFYNNHTTNTWYGFTISDAISIGLFIILLLVGNWLFNKKQLK